MELLQRVLVIEFPIDIYKKKKQTKITLWEQQTNPGAGGGGNSKLNLLRIKLRHVRFSLLCCGLENIFFFMYSSLIRLRLYISMLFH